MQSSIWVQSLKIRRSCSRWLLICIIAGITGAIAPSFSALGQRTEAKDNGRISRSNEVQRIAIVLARELRDVPPPLSLLDSPPSDEGIAGAKLAIADNNTTGLFLKQEFALDILESGSADELLRGVKKAVAAGTGFVVADAAPKTILALSAAIDGQNTLILNAGSRDDALREENSRKNVLHTAPSRAMLADALAQYLVWKRWRSWFLVHGTQPDDLAYAAALRRSAKRFGAKIVEERAYEYEIGNRRADGGHEQIQQKIPIFTQDLPNYDVLLIADESDRFGEYIPYRTWDARPVAGTQGLVPASWHPALEQWGGTQLQSRFQRLAKRPMRPLDYNVWIAIRSIGEAATRTKSADPKKLIAYIKSAEFNAAGFKGHKLSYRLWNGQLRQPILLSTPKLPVSVSPQSGFLHQFSEFDTLGIDEAESQCSNYKP